ncbi:MMPL family transporter [Pseudomonas baltica]|uniref:efflux RND transporter permease subunit n=1 Tax=Pseudomonas baltica TaxID=2762576 RepID=UPI002899E71E|nr:MMPL family transporter [Pseudomonas baltica]
MKIDREQAPPIVRDPRYFDTDGGNWLERLIFNHRLLMITICVVVTAVLGWQATQLEVNASFEKMIPQSHPYIQNYFHNREALPSAGNSIRVVVENTRGTIYDKDYLVALQRVNDALYLMPGVDRNWMRGLWTTSLRWTEVTEAGYQGGPVMPDRWDGSAQSMEQLQANISRANIVGSYVASDLKSSMIVVPLIGMDPDTRQPLDYGVLSRDIEQKIRTLGNDNVKIHVSGFAIVVGDLIAGLQQVMKFFAVSVLIATLFVLFYTRCLRSTVLLVSAATLGVIWLLGLMHLLGFVLDPYSILVPFLVFAIGLSHGAQKMNGIMQDVGRGMHKYAAARFTFRRLFLAGLTALLANIVGFAVLMIIDIPVIRDMALITSVGVTVLIFTKLVLIPVMLSYTGVSENAARRSIASQANRRGLGRKCWEALASLTERRRASVTLVLAALLVGGAFYLRGSIQIGDLDAGAPELRKDSRYNRDTAYITANYRLSGDPFIIMLKTPPGDCEKFQTLVEADRLGAVLRRVKGVQTTFSTADGARMATSGMFEGNPKWLSITRNTSTLSQAVASFRRDRPDLVDRTCAITPIIAYLADHRADTLTGVVNAVEAFAASHDTDGRVFQLAAGSAGIEAATNIVVKHSFWIMHFVLYGAVTGLCFLTFRSWRAVLVALIPLVITSVLCEALMVLLGIGIKVSTLPVIAVGVGVGVDYALYLLSVQLTLQRRGVPLAEAYMRSLDFTGRIVALVGLTMAAAVITWAWSPIKFQADMGILLTFMFVWNMIGALVLIPALSHFLLPSAPGRSLEGAPSAGTTDAECPAPAREAQGALESSETLTLQRYGVTRR